ncbi:MAG: nucleoside phosphorylase [Gammaproteobacteria bacterium]|nr:nucleoside phosphorylase [Gammaproteobacteria bacterium]
MNIFLFTGQYKGLDVSIMSTGMGPGCAEICMVEVLSITQQPAFIRVGSCGVLKESIPLGDLIITTGAVRLEDTSTYFVHEGYPAIASYEVVLALIMATQQQHIPYHVGITGSASGFYGAQARQVPGLPIRYPNLINELAAMNVLNLEMESSTIFNLANIKNCRASAICFAVNNRITNQFITPEDQLSSEKKSLLAGFEALLLLAKMDQQKTEKKQAYWAPDTI